MSFSTRDTIIAVATPPGRGGIGVVRVSGPDARAIAERIVTHRGELQARHATFTRVRSIPRGDRSSPAVDADPIDQAVVTFFPGPHSYTGEDVVELSAHGSP